MRVFAGGGGAALHTLPVGVLACDCIRGVVLAWDADVTVRFEEDAVDCGWLTPHRKARLKRLHNKASYGKKEKGAIATQRDKHTALYSYLVAQIQGGTQTRICRSTHTSGGQWRR